jgi:hypothetical protein
VSEKAFATAACKLCQGVALDLAYALARQAELARNRVERLRIAFETEPKLENVALPFRQRVERPADGLASQCLLRLGERVGRLPVDEGRRPARRFPRIRAAG